MVPCSASKDVDWCCRACDDRHCLCCGFAWCGGEMGAGGVVHAVCLDNADRCQLCERLFRFHERHRRRTASRSQTRLLTGVDHRSCHALRLAVDDSRCLCCRLATHPVWWMGDDSCGSGVRGVLLSLHHLSVLHGSWRCACARVLRLGACEHDLLACCSCLASVVYSADCHRLVVGLWFGYRHAARRQQLPRHRQRPTHRQAHAHCEDWR